MRSYHWRQVYLFFFFLLSFRIFMVYDYCQWTEEAHSFENVNESVYKTSNNKTIFLNFFFPPQIYCGRKINNPGLRHRHSCSLGLKKRHGLSKEWFLVTFPLGNLMLTNVPHSLEFCLSVVIFEALLLVSEMVKQQNKSEKVWFTKRKNQNIFFPTLLPYKLSIL